MLIFPLGLGYAIVIGFKIEFVGLSLEVVLLMTGLKVNLAYTIHSRVLRMCNLVSLVFLMHTRGWSSTFKTRPQPSTVSGK